MDRTRKERIAQAIERIERTGVELDYRYNPDGRGTRYVFGEPGVLGGRVIVGVRGLEEYAAAREANRPDLWTRSVSGAEAAERRRGFADAIRYGEDDR